MRHPPGDEIYRDDNLSVFEVDPHKESRYCYNLCMISNCYLDHKYLGVALNVFNFYVLCERRKDKVGLYMCGYFSKVRNQNPTESIAYDNLSCIMVLPIAAGNDYGKFLIDISYKLSMKEGRSGTPERPFSDGGHYIYLGYWTYRIINYLLSIDPKDISLQQIS